MKITKENIFEEARKGNLEVLKSDLIDKVTSSSSGSYGETPLHELAWEGVKEVLDHPSVDKVKDNYEQTPLHLLAGGGVKEVFGHSSVDKVKDMEGWTPLHWLADEGVKEVLDHPSVDKVKDTYGNTPLHRLAREGIKEVLNHPSVDKVKANNEWTPLHFLAWVRRLTKKDLKKLYPWYTLKGKITLQTINEIINTPQSVQFIKED